MGEKVSPLVSVLIPAYNRPDYLEIAIMSVLAQTYKNIEIIICDDSTNNDVQTMIVPFLKNYPQIKYFKNDKNLFLDNWHKCYDLASGEFINYLMDDDVFHEQKIEKMMAYYLEHEDITLVTSFRQLIDQQGNFLPPIKPTVCLFNETKILDGKFLGNYVLRYGINVIGEATTVLFRKKDLTEKFGSYKGKQYCGINDVATWISLLVKGKAVYISEALSYFRLHPNQNSSSHSIVSTGIYEWPNLIFDSREDGFLESQDIFKSALAYQRHNIRQLFLSNNPTLQQKKQEILDRMLDLFLDGN
ncbi:glycosyltransferase family 2 protein [Priestia megaterium]|uniref:glycosyltransferase family 2 protein n=1 Tax=Priestia megaterium TaxID=1404 RepID=UPI000BF37C31|nr:glycosyltransferase family 2 protein [Priestia megaterium]PFI91798.1 glycosyl transferase family 2 [Priestia megaterium]PGR14197.1 glycosyl transferase family 2 [Priestia megaterium]